MIISVSRRTDIPAFYPEWLMNRIHEQYVLVRNPLNYHQVSRISLKKDVVDFAVLWTKNAAPLLKYLPEIEDYCPFYIQYTLNAYDKDVEPGLKPLAERIECFRELSEMIGKERVIWRYDPVLITDRYSIDWHKNTYAEMSSCLKGYTDRCVFSYIDMYDKVTNNISGTGIRSCSINEMNILAKEFSDLARHNNISIQSCAEEIDLQQYGIEHGCCIDAELISQIGGFVIDAKKDKNQRDACGCIESIDIGQYNTCRHGCKYCYANFNAKTVSTLSAKHDPNSPLLIGQIESDDKITERNMKSLKAGAYGQMSLFD